MILGDGYITDLVVIDEFKLEVLYSTDNYKKFSSAFCAYLLCTYVFSTNVLCTCALCVDVLCADVLFELLYFDLVVLCIITQALMPFILISNLL